MALPLTVQGPGGFVPVSALSFGALDGPATVVDTTHPLPVANVPSQAAAGSVALAGNTAVAGIVGPFAPQLGREIVLTLSGSWAGTVQVMRSIDGGTTKLPVTIGGVPWGVFTEPCNEPVWMENEAGAALYLAITPSAGTVTYRVSQ